MGTWRRESRTPENVRTSRSVGLLSVESARCEVRQERHEDY